MLKTIETIIGHWVTFIKAHEKILIVLIAALTLIHFGDKAYDAYGNKLKAEQSATNAQIATVEKNNADLKATLQQLQAVVEANSKISDAKIAAAKQNLVVVQKIDAALPLPDLSKHWESMLLLSEGSILPQSNGTVAVTTDAAHATVAELEKIPALTSQLDATQDKLNGCTAVVKQQEISISGLNTAVDLEKKGRAEDAKIAKHDIRHAYFRGLKHGIVVGAVGTAALFVTVFH